MMLDEIKEKKVKHDLENPFLITSRHHFKNNLI